MSELLPIIVDRRNENPQSVICCIGYELNQWRGGKLVKFILDAIPEFVLTEEEINLLNPLKAFSTLEKALPHFTNVKNPSSGGEVGELIAHLICKRDFGTHHLVKRLAYKMRSRDAVTGFDLTHVRIGENKEIELWMGEAKFYGSRSDAITAAIKSLSDHIDEGVLTEKKVSARS